jgi:hypothetical protein
MNVALLALPALLGLAGVVMFGVGVGLRRRGTMLLGGTAIVVGVGGVIALRGAL